MLDLDALDAALKAATPGPWQTGDGHRTGVRDIFGPGEGAPIGGTIWHDEFGGANAALIVLLRNAAPALIAELRDLRARFAPVPAPTPGGVKPEVVCLCGSTRFINDISVLAWEMEKRGKIVFTPRLLPAGYVDPSWGGSTESHAAEAAGVKELVDETYKRKIDMSDRVFVVNIGGYIGSSTRSEIEYATAHGKPVDYLEPGACHNDPTLVKPAPTPAATGEADAYGVVNALGRIVTTCALRLNAVDYCREIEATLPEAGPYRVVALVVAPGSTS